MTLSATIRGQLLSLGLARNENMVGCSEDEIDQLEAECHLNLPIAYREFLIACGHGGGKFQVGTDWTYPELLELQATGRFLMQQNVPSVEFPLNAFVFSSHQGYQFLYFHCGVSEDPPVYYFLENETGPSKVVPTFTSWLQGCIQDDVDAYKELGD